jgi:hypothetical protein
MQRMFFLFFLCLRLVRGPPVLASTGAKAEPATRGNGTAPARRQARMSAHLACGRRRLGLLLLAACVLSSVSLGTASYCGRAVLPSASRGRAGGALVAALTRLLSACARHILCVAAALLRQVSLLSMRSLGVLALASTGAGLHGQGRTSHTRTHGHPRARNPSTHTHFCALSPGETLRLRGGATEEAISVPSFVTDKNDFNHVIRIFNTNLHGHRTVLYSLTGIKGVGRRFGDAVIKRAGVDGSRRMGELSAEEVEKLVQVRSCARVTPARPVFGRPVAYLCVGKRRNVQLTGTRAGD